MRRRRASSAREGTDELGVCGKRRQELARFGHAEIDEVEAGSYGAAAERVAGGMARAAHRLAQARCAMHGSSLTPTLRELQAAASTLGTALGIRDSIPVSTVLASDCEGQGLPVIRPIQAAASNAQIDFRHAG